MALTRIFTLAAANVAVAVTVFFSAGPADTPAWAGMDEQAAAGQRLWQAKNCVACHAVYGLGGHLGPDLTNTLSRRGEDYGRAILTHGLGKMPPQQLTDQEIEEVIAYLRYLDASGVYPTKSFPDYAFGKSRGADD